MVLKSSSRMRWWWWWWPPDVEELGSGTKTDHPDTSIAAMAPSVTRTSATPVLTVFLLSRALPKLLLPAIVHVPAC